MALGHPVGTNGARISYSLALEMNEGECEIWAWVTLYRRWARNCAITGKTLDYTLYWLDTQYEKDKRKAAPGGCFLYGRVCQFKLSVGFTPIIATHLFCRIK
ncbi:hypothetical protein [Cytobacillus oceanisediminis]|uniref:hypothetical protein n=1 Tax=Cytobacillus oceanisediminis TaxID=665099 RepID=UPI00338FCAAB